KQKQGRRLQRRRLEVTLLPLPRGPPAGAPVSSWGGGGGGGGGGQQGNINAAALAREIRRERVVLVYHPALFRLALLCPAPALPFPPFPAGLGGLGFRARLAKLLSGAPSLSAQMLCSLSAGTCLSPAP
ncbi:unnamed protein product, partial [Urochloa humidicola]